MPDRGRGPRRPHHPFSRQGYPGGLAALPGSVAANHIKFVHRVQIKNYRSIGACNVDLEDLTFLVGQNGSGKSNFLDALGFVTDALRSTLDHALRDRGGINEVRRHSGGHPTHFGIRLDFAIKEQTGHFAFEVGAMPNGGFRVRRERFSFRSHRYEVSNGEVVQTTLAGPAVTGDRLYFGNLSGFPEVRPAYDALSSMGFYSLNPEQIRDHQPPDAGVLLARDGRNLASVLAHLEAEQVSAKERIVEYLSQVVAGIEDVERRGMGQKETLEFRQQMQGSAHPWRFQASNMSDGTLRALGVLVSLFQTGNGSGTSAPLVGIEEPAAALHPGASGALLDALVEASQFRQVLVTTHSPDLIDDRKIDAGSLLSVVAESGVTKVSPVAESNRKVLQEHLFSAGELLRLNQLKPDIRLFESVPSS
ncbi:MAG: AAA family ATPase [Bryobacteraceae bacterium]